jgi:hypothetical protein
VHRRIGPIELVVDIILFNTLQETQHDSNTAIKVLLPCTGLPRAEQPGDSLASCNRRTGYLFHSSDPPQK